jgi:hypothetical protein
MVLVIETFKVIVVSLVRASLLCYTSKQESREGEQQS